jgi:hypothetical protein
MMTLAKVLRPKISHRYPSRTREDAFKNFRLYVPKVFLPTLPPWRKTKTS